MRGITQAELNALAAAVGVRPEDVKPMRFARRGAPPSGPTLSLEQLERLAKSMGVRTPVSSEIPTGYEDFLRGRSGAKTHTRRAPANTGYDREWVARHEAGHAAVALILGFDVESVRASAETGGLTRAYPPDDLYGPGELERAEAVYAAAGVASTRTQYGPGADEDRSAVRLLGGMRWEEAVRRAREMLADEWAGYLRDGIAEALVQVGALDGNSLGQVVNDCSRSFFG